LTTMRPIGYCPGQCGRPGICEIRTIPTEIDYSEDFGPSDRPAWDAEYAANVKAMDWLATGKLGLKGYF